LSDELAALIDRSGSAVQFVEGDVTNDDAVKTFLDPAGEYDALVNNAGAGIDGLLAVQPVSAIDSAIDLNLRAALICSRGYIRARLRNRLGGGIVNVSSIVGVRGYAGLSVYSASKAGMLGMTRSLARELGSKGIRVNAVLPGYLETELSAGLGDEQREQIRRRTPLGRLGEIDDVVPLVLFLISDESRFITGAEFVVDGGITI
jgi:3-oxoacyl-[acyl-carrier protein] reductase